MPLVAVGGVLGPGEVLGGGGLGGGGLGEVLGGGGGAVKAVTRTRAKLQALVPGRASHVTCSFVAPTLAGNDITPSQRRISLDAQESPLQEVIMMEVSCPLLSQ